MKRTVRASPEIDPLGHAGGNSGGPVQPPVTVIAAGWTATADCNKAAVHMFAALTDVVEHQDFPGRRGGTGSVVAARFGGG